MNPKATGHLVGHVRAGLPQFSERELTWLARRTWTCSRCGHVVSDLRQGRLRERARDHAKTCATVAV